MDTCRRDKPQFVPFDEEPPKIGNQDAYYRYPQAGNQFGFALGSPLEDELHRARDKVIKGFYDEIDGVICCMMAAGVSEGKIIMTTPKVYIDGNTATIGCYLGCIP